MNVLKAALVAVVIAGMMHHSLDSGRYAPPSGRLVSLPLVGLAVIFATRAWTARSSFWSGLAAGVGGYALVRLAL